MAPPTSHCPKCRSDSIRRSRTRNRWERWRREITGKRPFRCRVCNWRGWLPTRVADLIDAREQVHRAAADPPNLRGTAFMRTDPRAEFDVKQLDSFHQNPDRDSK